MSTETYSKRSFMRIDNFEDAALGFAKSLESQFNKGLEEEQVFTVATGVANKRVFKITVTEQAHEEDAES